MLVSPAFNVVRPCILAKYNPITAVKKMSIIVFKAPIFWPTLIIMKISMTGSVIIKSNIVFICLIQNYIINVYLANNEQ